MALNLSVIFLTFADFCSLLLYLELHFIGLHVGLRHLIIQFSALLGHLMISLSGFCGYLLNSTLSSLNSILSLGQSSQNVAGHCVDMKLGLTDYADKSEILRLVFWVEHGEWEHLIDAVLAAKSCTELALSPLFASKLSFTLATDRAIVLNELRILDFATLGSETLSVDLRKVENVLLRIKGESQIVWTNSNHCLPTVKFVCFLNSSYLLYFFFELLFKILFIGHHVNNALIDVYKIFISDYTRV